MKALILTEGGRNIGFGHLTRCLAFAQALKVHTATRNSKIDIVVCGEASEKQFLNKQGVQPVLADWIRHRAKILGRVKAADLILIDSYKAPAALYSWVARLNPDAVILAINDFKRLDYDVDAVINPSVYGDELKYKKDVYGQGRPQYLLGKDYIIVRQEFQRQKRKSIRRAVKNILVTLGGMDHGNFLQRMADFLLNNYPHMQFGMVTAQKNLKLKAQSLKRYSGLSAAAMKKLMERSDLCISGCGQTLHELARCGTPTVGICLADNQRLNARYFQEKGFLQYAGEAKDRNIFLNVGQGMQRLANSRIREQRSAVGQRLVDGQGAARIIAVALQIKKEKIMTLRPVRRADCRDIWLWRNHPDVRKYAFQSQPISYAEHQKWFQQMERAPQVELYIAENLKKEKVGQARFYTDCCGASFISVNLNPKFFGRRLGSRLIKDATQIFLKRNPAVKHVLAEIISSNVSSQKAFAKAEYRHFKRSRKDDQSIVTYVFRRDDGCN